MENQRPRPRSQGPPDEDSEPIIPFSYFDTPRRQRGRPPQRDVSTTRPHLESLARTEERGHPSTARTFNPTNKIDTDLIEYVEQKTREYKDHYDYDLWQIMSEDFKHWNLDHFRMVPNLALVQFRKLIRTNGIYSNHKVPPADALNATLKDSFGPDWNEQRFKDLILYNGTNVSPRLKEKFAYLLDNRSTSPKLSPKSNHATRVQSEKVESTTPRQSPILEAPTRPINTAPSFPTSTYPVTSNAFSNQHQTMYSGPYGDEEKRTTNSLVQLSKIYTEEMKYSGSEDAFDWKYQIFLDLCQRAGVPATTYARRLAFPTMLKGSALSHYYAARSYWESRNVEPNIGMKDYFEGVEQQRTKQQEWSMITLQRTIEDPKNAGKLISECLEVMLQKIQLLYYSLPNDLRNDTVYHLKLLEATRLHPACGWATAKPSTSIPGLIQDLRSCVAQYQDRTNTAAHNMTESDAYYTDRRYHGQQSRPTYRTNDNRRSTPSSTPTNLRCYVCQKMGCYSTKHTKEEREEAKRRFRERMNKRADHHFAQQDDIKEDIKTEPNTAEDAAEALVTEEVDSSPSHNMFTKTYFCSATPAPEKGESIAQELAERTAHHYVNVVLAPTGTNAVIGQLDPPHVQPRALANQDPAYQHQIVEPHTEPHSIFMTERYSKDVFQGLLLDTGAADFSTGGYEQFLAYKRINKDAILDKSTERSVSVKFGVGDRLWSIGSINIRTPVGTIQFYIMESTTPFLLSLKDLDRLKVYFDNTRNVLVGPGKGQTTPVVRRFGHPFLVWDDTYGTYLVESFDMNPCFLTENELRRLHRRFGHPSTERLHRVLERAGYEVDTAAMEHIRKFCHHCQTQGSSPGRFRFTLRDDVHFNHSIIIDIMWIDGRTVLHTIDEATRFQAARWLPDMRARTVWDTLRAMWIDTYLGPPDFIVTDAGTNFTSKEFSQLAANVGTLVKTVPVEAHWSIGMVERYHGVLRRIYTIIDTDLPTMANTLKLQMAVKAVNDTAGPDGYTPTLLVFGAYPRLVEYDPPAPSVTQRAAVLRKATDEVRRLYAERQTREALNTHNGPSSLAVLSLPINSDVLVWREGNNGRAGRWTGPYKLLAVNGETCTVAISKTPTEFRSTVVKPYRQEELPDGVDQQDQPQTDDQPKDSDNSDVLANEIASLPTPIVVIPAIEAGSFVNYGPSQDKEINGLLEREVFEIVPNDEIPDNVRIFGTRFVNEVKNAGTIEAYEKSRLVVQAYNDPEKGLVLRTSPTIQRSSQRLLIAIVAHTAISFGAKLYLRDVTQAYVQSGTNLNRDFYVRPLPEIKDRFPAGCVLKVVKPLYGIPEAGNHWFEAYYRHHQERLKMDSSIHDPCLLHTKDPEEGFGVVGLQTDDTLILADDKFAEREDHEIRAAKIDCKPRQQLALSTPLKFNGGIITEDGQGVILTQQRSLKQIQLVKDHNADMVSSRGKIRKDMSPHEQYVSQRALGAYIASLSQPEAAFDLSYAAQTTNPIKQDIDALNKRLKWQMDNVNRGLRFVKIDMKTAKLMVFADASFAGNRDYSSQIGYVVILVDADNNANILHWSSTKCKRITRSVLAVELYALANAFDTASAIRDTLMQVLHMTERLPLIVCTDSKSIYDCLVKLGTTQEKRLMIDLLCLRQAFERQEIDEVKWIDGNTNPADAMTKAKPCSALKNLIDTNKLQLHVEGWTEHTTLSKA